MTTTVTMWLGDVRRVMDRLIQEGRTYDFIVTSPPFWALRSYLPGDHPDKEHEIGGEPTPGEYLDTLYGLTDQWGQLIPEWASIAVELGDTMSGSGGAGGDYDDGGLREGQERFDGSSQRERNADESRRGVDRKNRGNTSRGTKARPEPKNAQPDARYGSGRGWEHERSRRAMKRDAPVAGMPLAKSMCIIPHSYTFGLAYGINPHTGQPTPAGQWRVRNVVNWARPNPPVGSLGKRNVQKRTGDQRFRYASSFITIACRNRGRYFDLDAVRVEPSENTHNRVAAGREGRFDLPSQQRDGNWSSLEANNDVNPAGSPPLDWHTDDLDGDWLWRLNTSPYPGSHYAVYPLALPRRLLLAMCPARVCTQCGWPSERIVVAAEGYDEHLGKSWADKAEGRGKANTGARSNHAGQPIGKPHIVNAEYVTVGWTDCECFAGFDDRPGGQAQLSHWRRGHVLDPFGGSGTTAVAAALEGRDATLIDFDVRNVALVHGRLDESLHIIDCKADDEKVVWKVEAPLPNQKAQIDGQMSFLGDFA